MRLIFVAPLCTPRHRRVIVDVAGQLVKDDHDVHVFARESTRVEHGGKCVLSRNQAQLLELDMAFGRDRVSRLHSHASRALSGEDMLAAADRERIRRFVSAYAPDAIVVCEDELVGHGGALLDNVEMASGDFLSVRFKAGMGNGGWTVEVDSKVVAPLPDTSGIREFLHANVLSRLDIVRSRARLNATVSARKLPSESGDAGYTTTARGENPGAEKPAVAGKGVRVSSTRGEIESVKDGDVVLGDCLWLKGWVDFSLPQLKCLVIRVNDRIHRCYPQLVRGELVERNGFANILGFEVRLPVAEEGPRLNVAVMLMTEDGKLHGWKKLFLWADRSVPARYRTPVVVGEASCIRNGETLVIRGNAAVDGYKMQAVRAVQFGRTVKQSFAKENGKVEIDILLDFRDGFDLLKPVHLWLDIEGEEEVFWQRVQVPGEGMSNGALVLDAPPEGTVVRSENFSLCASTDSAARSARLFFNGVESGRCDITDGKGSLSVSAGNHANSLLIEALDDAGCYTSRLVWHYLEAPEERKHQTLVAVPSDIRLMTMSRRDSPSRRMQRLLLIRRAPAPTDELYVLAPLRKFVTRGALEVVIIDTDTAELSEADLDKYLAPGTHVVVSRYVTDQLVEQITARKASLGSVFYLMDDDVIGAEDSRWLPGGYRSRMMRVAHGEFQAMVALCDRFIVTCDFLARRYASDKTDLIEPPYLHPPANLKHLSRNGEIVVAYHGTMVHRDDINAISPALQRLHDKYAHVRIQIVMGDYVPAVLKGLSRVEVVPAMPWDDYKKFIEKVRAHIALAPILDTPYNLGKSVIKIMDIAALGAVGVYTRREPYTKYVSNGENGFLLENDPLMWEKTLSWLVERPDAIYKMAVSSQKLAQSVGAIERLEHYWQRALGLPQ